MADLNQGAFFNYIILLIDAGPLGSLRMLCLLHTINWNWSKRERCLININDIISRRRPIRGEMFWTLAV